MLAPRYFEEADNRVNQRVAKIISEMDPFEPLMKQFHGVFSQEYERPEEKLSPQGQLGMAMWGYQQSRDPHFGYMTDWIMNTQANETLKRAPVTTERVMYGRAQISSMLIFTKEVKRLASIYEDIMNKSKEDPDFNDSAAVDT